MALVITQRPKYHTNPGAQRFIYTISEDQGISATASAVKFIAVVYIGNDKSLVTAYNTSQRVATLKTTPNGAGVGMFDLRPIIESFVSPDYEGSNETINTQWNSFSTFKNLAYGNTRHFPIHTIDRCALGVKSTTWVTVQFYLEYFDADSSLANQVAIDPNLEVNSQPLFVFNGVLYNEDLLNQGVTSYGYVGGTDWSFGFNYNLHNLILNDTDAKFLTQAPTTQYARLTDYGTFSFFNMLNTTDFSFETGGGITNKVADLKLNLYDSADVQLGSEIDLLNAPNNDPAVVSAGGAGQYGHIYSYAFLLYMGVFPGNFTNWMGSGTDWYDNLSSISYYTLQAFNDDDEAISQLYTINIICPNSFGYEGVRLTWLNKFGTWDYYTFNQKSVRSVNTKKSTYTQLGGTWNEDAYKPAGYKGGRKNFRVNSKERIKLNTDFLNDLEGKWIEGVITSPEVYIVNDYSDAADTVGEVDFTGMINKYVEPVIVTTSNFVRKTKANDKLIQYTIDIERNKDQRQQAI